MFGIIHVQTVAMIIMHLKFHHLLNFDTFCFISF